MEDYIRYALSGVSAVCVPIRWSTFRGVHAWSIYCILYHRSYNHDNMNETADSRSVDYVPDGSLTSYDWITLSLDYQLWITSLQSAWWIYTLNHGLSTLINCGLPHCGLLSPEGFTLCHELSTVDYLTVVFFPWRIHSLPWITNCGLPRCGLCPDGFCLHHELSTVDYLTIVAIPWWIYRVP